MINKIKPEAMDKISYDTLVNEIASIKLLCPDHAGYLINII